jgi:hypothetical protein
VDEEREEGDTLPRLGKEEDVNDEWYCQRVMRKRYYEKPLLSVVSSIPDVLRTCHP